MFWIFPLFEKVGSLSFFSSVLHGRTVIKGTLRFASSGPHWAEGGVVVMRVISGTLEM